MNEKETIKDYLEEYENMPELQCNHCGTIFKGDHECDYDKIKMQNKRYRELINNINKKAMLFGADEQVYEAIQDAIKALEGDPHES